MLQLTNNQLTTNKLAANRIPSLVCLTLYKSFCKLYHALAHPSLWGNQSNKYVYFQALSTRDVIPHFDDLETVPVPSEVRVVVKHTTTEDAVHGTQVTSDRRKDSAARQINLADGAFTDEPELPEVAEKVLDKTSKRGKLSMWTCFPLPLNFVVPTIVAAILER